MVKAGDDRLVALAAVFFASGVAGLAALPFVPVPAAAAWPWLAASVAIHVLYVAGLVGAYTHGDLSRVYPLARGCGPLLVALVAGRLVGEHLTLFQVAGLLLASAGIIGLAMEPGAFGVGRRGTLWALFTGATIAGYTVADGMGGRASGDAIGYTAWLFACQIPFVPLYAWLRRPAAVRAYLTGGQWKRGTGGGMVALASYGIAIWAMSVAPMALVAALRETSVLFAALIGTLILREAMGTWRIGAAILVVAGQLLMNLGTA
ncbi:EamA-like transporter family protein [Stella humosa]|uniref:EamA-like transporter family protein n=2 Tax=Stella humosa TaxID=94 RepID=A0A3N1M7R6_9PROT|nr:EamA-like transporter family protein [Stella humosa]BBK31043.1 peptide ABC transporter permease [Stella humosa]